ncbi:XRE family transcriptional regulator [Prauserella marina]|uniref:Zn-dependent peptidase ImmA, M78 family n=1 Tax=Prauserella marina TaxID=530584 RepID=A0A222VJB3_9PSEU|nr:XRE family transcriptional regulator [Prauserella marina]ASR33863.1 XRE family transcriptional regulator [Prauserella marina]PWV82452.1 Zn-dependent peptidase ImmA (M78 family) [Prauserella marina]SDC69544.1 Zn-dependent peptidase ImmA, M78 family [Prauserella marina]
MIEFGEVLVTARRARGLTQEQLAEKAQVTQAALSRYENDLREPDDEILERLAEPLGVTAAFLKSAGQVRGGMALEAHMRRRQTAKPTVWRQLEAKLNMYRMHARLVYEDVAVLAEQSVPRLDPFEVSPEAAARMVRMQWRMPLGPVRNLTRWIEAAACVVIEEDFGTARVDGLSQWVDDYPVILINRRSPTDRKRLTLAHELGHLVLHSVDVSQDMEAEANNFAAEFLTPADLIRPQLRTVTTGRLHDLKREWGVSMQALVERSYQLRTIKATQRTNLYKSFSAKGWRIKEPLSEELAPEVPQLVSAIGQALAGKGYSASDVARLAGFSAETANHPFSPPSHRLRAV